MRPLKVSKGCGDWICLWICRWLKSQIHAQEVLWQYGRGMAGMSGRGSLTVGSLAWHHCSAVAVLLTLHIIMPLWTEEHHLAHSSKVCSQVSGLMPDTSSDIYGMSLRHSFWPSWEQILFYFLFLAVAQCSVLLGSRWSSVRTTWPPIIARTALG